jgi:hypothetical protein
MVDQLLTNFDHNQLNIQDQIANDSVLLVNRLYKDLNLTKNKYLKNKIFSINIELEMLKMMFH